MNIEILNKDKELVVGNPNNLPHLVLSLYKNGRTTMKVQILDDFCSIEKDNNKKLPHYWAWPYNEEFKDAGYVKLQDIKILAKLFEPVVELYRKSKPNEFYTLQELQSEFHDALTAIYRLFDPSYTRIFDAKHTFSLEEDHEFVFGLDEEDYDKISRYIGLKSVKDIYNSKVHKKIMEYSIKINGNDDDFILTDLPQGLKALYEKNILKLSK